MMMINTNGSQTLEELSPLLMMMEKDSQEEQKSS